MLPGGRLPHALLLQQVDSAPPAQALDGRPSFVPSADDNAQALSDYLTASSELPESTRRWPAWQQRLVPRIVAALSGRQVGSGGGGLEAAHPAGGEAEEGCDAAGMSGSGALDGADAQQLGAAALGPGGSDKSAAAAADGGQEVQEAPAQKQPQRSQEEIAARRWQQQQPPGLDAAAAEPHHTAAPGSGGAAKENRQPASKLPGAGSPAAAVAVKQRKGSVRQRRANSQLAGYLLEYE